MTRTKKTVIAWAIILCWAIIAKLAISILGVPAPILAGGGLVLGMALSWEGFYLFPFMYPREEP